MESDPYIFSVEQLEVVGYADAFDTLTVPRRVPAIFSVKSQTDRCVFPPYRLSGPWVIDGALTSTSYLSEMIAQRRATPLPAPREAEPDALLWIDDGLHAHYGPKDQENEILLKAAELRVRNAEAKFRQGDYETALADARWASAAAEESLYAIVLEAASLSRLLALRGESESQIDTAITLLRDQAVGLPDSWRFDSELEQIRRAAAPSDPPRPSTEEDWIHVLESALAPAEHLESSGGDVVEHIAALQHEAPGPPSDPDALDRAIVYIRDRWNRERHDRVYTKRLLRLLGRYHSFDTLAFLVEYLEHELLRGGEPGAETLCAEALQSLGQMDALIATSKVRDPQLWCSYQQVLIAATSHAELVPASLGQLMRHVEMNDLVEIVSTALESETCTMEDVEAAACQQLLDGWDVLHGALVVFILRNPAHYPKTVDSLHVSMKERIEDLKVRMQHPEAGLERDEEP